MSKFVSVKIRERKKTAPPNLHSLLHNLRYGKLPSYLLPKELRQENYHLHPTMSAEKNWNKWNDEIQARYTKEHKRKMRSDSVALEEGLIILSDEQVRNCNPDEIWEKMLEYIKWFEERFDTKVRTLDWHRDEGEIELGRVKYNEHAHFIFDDVDSRGEKIRNKWSRYGTELKEMQDKVAEIFAAIGFIRGVPLKEGEERPYRTPKQQRKHAAKKVEQKLIKTINKGKAKIKDVTTEAEKIRKELKKEKAKRAEYAELEALTKKLKAEAKAKELTMEELKSKMETLEKRLLEQINDLKKVNAKQEAELNELKSDLAMAEVAQTQKDAQIGDLEALLSENQAKEPDLIESLEVVAQNCGLPAEQVFQILDKEINRLAQPVPIEISEKLVDYEKIKIAHAENENPEIKDCRKPTEKEQSKFWDTADLISQKLAELLEMAEQRVSKAWKAIRESGQDQGVAAKTKKKPTGYRP